MWMLYRAFLVPKRWDLAILVSVGVLRFGSATEGMCKMLAGMAPTPPGGYGLGCRGGIGVCQVSCGMSV